MPLGSSRVLVGVALLALALRLFSAGLAFKANVVFPLKLGEQFTVLDDTHYFWDAFARWDSGWYRGIAMNGYQFVEGGRSNLAFFPVYPMARRLAGRLLGGDQFHYYLGGVVVSWVAFVVAAMLLYALARLDVDEAAALRVVAYCAIFPFAFFFGMVYAESLFLCLMLGAFYAVRTRRWALSGVLGALAFCTRVSGIMALPALAYLAWKAAGADHRERLAATAAVGAMVVGFAAWCGFNFVVSGSPFEWYHSITRWGYQPGGAPWTPFVLLLQALVTRPYEFLMEAMAPYDTLNGLTALSFTALVIPVWRRFGPAYGLYMLANLWLPLSSGQFEGLGRYCSVLFPAFIWIGSAVGPWAQLPVAFGFSTLYMLGLALFVNVHPLF